MHFLPLRNAYLSSRKFLACRKLQKAPESFPNCHSNNTPVETIQMDTANGLQVSMTLDFIAFFTFNKARPKLEHSFLSQLSIHCKLIRFLLLFFHQLSDGDGLDSEATRDSTLGSSSEMIIEVSLTIVSNIAVVMMILAKKTVIKEA